METQLRFYFIDAVAINNITKQTNYYVECEWEENNKIFCTISKITEGVPDRPKLNLENRQRFIPTFNFEFSIEDVNPPQTITQYFQYKGSDELDEREVAVYHEREGFTYCADEVQNYIIKNSEKWQQITE